MGPFSPTIRLFEGQEGVPYTLGPSGMDEFKTNVTNSAVRTKSITHSCTH